MHIILEGVYEGFWGCELVSEGRNGDSKFHVSVTVTDGGDGEERNDVGSFARLGLRGQSIGARVDAGGGGWMGFLKVAVLFGRTTFLWCIYRSNRGRRW